MRAANHRPLVRPLDRPQLLLLQFGQNEAVDGCFGPPSVLYYWRRWLLNRLKRPELPLFRSYCELRFLHDRRHCWLGVLGGPESGHRLNPVPQIGDLIVLEFGAAHGHLQLRVQLGNGLDEQALVGPSRKNSRAGFSTCQKGDSRVDPQTAEFAVGVAGVTAIREH